MSSVQTQKTASPFLSSLIFCFALLTTPLASALTAQTITSFAPVTPILFSTGGTFALTATGGGSGNPVVFASATASICTVAGSTVTKVAVGTCNLTANQAGNATFSAAAQVSKSVVISKGTQTITFAALSGKAFGAAPFTVAATASSGLTVAFTSTTTGICTISASTVTIVTVGTCTIAANQAGNTNFNAATQVSQSFAIAKGAQTITFAALAGKNFGVAPFTVAATASSALAVAFTSTTTPVCTISGATVTLVSVGTCTIAANQAGNANYNVATQVAQSFTVAKGAQTITFAALSGKGFGVAPFAVSAIASSGFTVVFTSTTLPVCTVSGSTVTLVALGTCTIAANQAGNTNYNAATQVAQSFTVAKGAQTITFVALVGKALGAAPFAVSATSSSGLAVVFTSTTAPVCTVSGATVTIVAVGTCTITANQAGNTNYNAATQVAQSFAVTSGTQAITFAALIGKTFGIAPFSVSATASSGLAVSFTSTTAAVCTVASANVTLVAVGTCTIAANQAGNGSFSAAPQVTQSFAVAKSAQTITFAALPGKTLGNAPFPLSATASSGLVVAFTSTTAPVCTVIGSTVTLVSAGTCTIAANQTGNGNISAAIAVPQSFTVASAALIAQTITGFAPASPIAYASGGNFAVSASGGASNKPVIFASTSPSVCTVSGSTVSIVAAGNCALTANQAGDTTYSAAPQVTANVSIAPATQTISFASLASKLLASMPFSVSGAASSGLSVTFTSSTSAVCTVAGATITLVSVGTCTINGNQSGNGNYSAAPQATQSFNVVNGISTIYNVPLAAGDSHNCALTNTNGVKCWGLNQLGQIGDGTVVDKYTPTDVVGLASGVAAVTAGSQHSCAITIAGGVKCWGNNYYGQLGDNTTIQSNTPVNVVGLTSGVVAVSAGEGHTCAITKVGGVKCWGYNGVGQLGDGSGTNQLTPTDVFGLDSGVIDVRAGGTHTCAATATGNVKCWGNNIVGQLGDGDSSGTVQYTPINVVNLSPGMLGVESGSTHSCGLTSVGGVLCWGNNVNGQLGNGNNTAQFYPVNVVGLPSVTSIIAGGYYSSCALNVAGQIQCWGGRVGSNIPVNIDDFIGGVTEVAIGSNHTCVMITGGGVRCWGSNSKGQLGDGTTNYASSPITATGFAGTMGISQAITFTAMPNQSLGNGQAGLFATATSKLAVTFTSNTNSVCTVSASTVNFIAAGTCTIAADQSGDGNYGAAPQIIQSFTLSIASQIITGFTPTTPISYAAGGYFVISASAVGGGSGNPVVFASTSPTVCSVSGGIAFILTPGTCNLTADQAGNASYSSAPQLTATVVIQKTPQSISFWTTPFDVAAKSVITAPFQMVAYASSNLIVSFTSNTPSVCSVSGATLTLLAVGTCNVVADQAGDSYYSAAPSEARSFAVIQAAQAITQFVPASPVIYSTGGVFALNATGGASGTPVVFASTTASVCSVTGNVVTLLTTGNCGLTANQAGNILYSPAPTATASVVISVSNQTIIFNSLPNKSPNSAPFTIAANSTSNLSVSFSSSSPGACTVAGSTVTMVSAGICTITANQSGNSNFNAAPAVARSFSVVSTLPSLVTPTLANAIFGQPYTATLMIGSLSTLSAATISGLPAGLDAVHNGSGAVIISGVPTAQGSFTATVTATNADGTINPTFSLNVASYANNVDTIATGANHSCVAMNGGVQCWGANGNGQLGNNTVTSGSNLPVIAIAPGNNATFVTAGTNHSCATVGGKVQCWGANNAGQLGTNDNTPRSYPSGTYQSISGNASVVSAGELHTCAIAGGAVYCWGANSKGQVDGHGGIGGSGGALSPAITLPPSSNATALSLGSSHSCAVVGGGLKCWGDNTWGQLGDNTTSNGQIVDTFAPGSGVTAVAAGSRHTCAIVNGSVQCWGDNSGGQLGNNTLVASLLPVVVIAANSNVTAIAAGLSNTCAIINGGLQCWGAKLGPNLSNFYPQSAQTPTSIFPANSNVSSIAIGYGHICAIVNGSAQCWGSNYYGQLGNVYTSQMTVPVAAIPLGSHVASVAASTSHTCAVINGAVQCWGDNGYGQLGNTTISQSATPVSVAIASSNANMVSGGSGRICAVISGGISCWGLTRQAQAGYDFISEITGSLAPIASGNNIIAVATGDSHECVLANGGVQCRGYSNSGQLGNGSFNSSVPLTVAIPTGSGATALSAGASHTCAITNGGLQCWGYNGDGEIGDNTAQNRPLPTAIFTANSSVTALAGGSKHTCAVINGGVQCWGLNDRGQLGNNTITSSLTPVVALPPGSNATAVAVGISHTCALANGGVQCWGSNANGQLGNNTITPSNVPVIAIPAGSNIIAITASGNHTCAQVGDGLVCWGDNSFGQLADLNSYYLNKVFAAIPPMAAPTVPSAPTITNAVAGPGNAVLTFAAPTSNGGIALSTYTATCIAAANLTLTASAAANATTATIVGLVSGVSYSCTLTASNTVGPSAASNSVMVTSTSLSTPSAPTLTSAVPGPNSALLTFTAPTNNGGSVITGYVARCAAVGNPTITTNAAGNATTAIVSGLIGNITYSCSITATNAIGTSAASNSLTVTPTPVVAPSAPTLVSAVPGAGSALLSYIAPINNGGSVITGYIAACTASGNPTITANAAGNVTTATAVGLVGGIAYSCSVAATNTAGTGASSNNMAVTSTSAIAPTAPTLTSAVPGPNSALLTFTAPTNNGGSLITGYVASCAAVGNPTITTNAPANATTATVSGLIGNIAYSCAIAATNAIGSSAASNSLAVTPTPAVAPSAPTLVSAVPGAGSALLTFTSPTNNGGSAITGYLATCTASGNPTVTANAPANATTATVAGLISGVVYSCSVVASNSAGASVASNVIAVTPTAIAPIATITAPANATTVNALSPITVSVNGQSQVGTVASIELLDGTTRVNIATLTGSNNNTINFTGVQLTAGVHTLTAKVVDSVGNVGTSPAITITALAAPTVTLSSASAFNLAPASIDLYVNAVANGSGNTITSLKIYNGTTVLATFAAPPYNYRWINVVAGTYSLTAKAIDSAGSTTTTVPLIVTVGTALTITPAAGLDGSTVSEVDTLISGTVTAPPNSSVSINGQIATLTPDGQFFINHFPLQSGANSITISLHTPDGQTVNQTITVARNLVPVLFTVTVGDEQGFVSLAAPFSTKVTIGSSGGIAPNTITLACQDPIPGAPVTALGIYVCSYDKPGLYTIAVIVKNATGIIIYSVFKRIKVFSPGDNYQVVAGVYNSLIDRLKAGSTSSASSLFVDTRRATYQALFDSFGSNLSVVVNQLGTLKGGSMTDTHAELIVIRTTADGPTAFPIHFVLDPDGIWRIDSM